jgi:hypothetical protein
MGWRHWKLKRRPIERFRARHRGVKILVEFEVGRHPFVQIDYGGRRIRLNIGAYDLFRFLSSDYFAIREEGHRERMINSSSLAAEIIKLLKD